MRVSSYRLWHGSTILHDVYHSNSTLADSHIRPPVYRYSRNPSGPLIPLYNLRHGNNKRFSLNISIKLGPKNYGGDLHYAHPSQFPVSNGVLTYCCENRSSGDMWQCWDMSAAFDCVDYAILLQRLRSAVWCRP